MTAKKIFLDEKEFYAGLPRKRVSSSMILRNATGEVLIVKPNYRDFWLLPGGVTEPEEAPRDGAIRETREEIGVDVTEARFAAIEFLPAHGNKTESLHFLFDGGTLSADQIARMALRDGEIDEYRFLSPDDAYALLNPFLSVRLRNALAAVTAGTVAYLENGERK